MQVGGGYTWNKTGYGFTTEAGWGEREVLITISVCVCNFPNKRDLRRKSKTKETVCFS